MLFDLVLGADAKDARVALGSKLSSMKRAEPEFYISVIDHCPRLKYSADQWFDFLSKIPNRLFRYEPVIMGKLSPNQRENLPPAVFEAY